MMNARDVAVAALSDVVANEFSASHKSDMVEASLTRSTNNPAGASMEYDISKNAHATISQKVNAPATDQSNASNDSQETASTSSNSEGFSSQSQESPSQFSQLSQHTNPTVPTSRATGAAPPTLSIATNAGQKRTHDGYTKPPDSASSASPPIQSFGGHSRNTSNISIASSTVSNRDVRLPGLNDLNMWELTVCSLLRTCGLVFLMQ
jgi:hypothetical protein